MDAQCAVALRKCFDKSGKNSQSKQSNYQDGHIGTDVKSKVKSMSSSGRLTSHQNLVESQLGILEVEVERL